MTAFIIFLLFSLVASLTTLEIMEQNLYLSYAAYCPGPLIDDWSCYWCKRGLIEPLYRNYSYEAAHQTLFWTGVYGDQLYLVYRGTPNPVDKLIDWIMDFDFVQIPCPYAPRGVLIHKGFWDLFSLLKDDMIVAVNSILEKYPSVTKITISGHSMGCSLAHLAGLVLFKEGNDRFQQILKNGDLTMMTFAAPRLGNQAFVDYYTSLLSRHNIYRVVNQRDIVTALPPHFTLYDHLPTEYWFPNTTLDYMKCDGSGEDPNCSDSLTKWSIPDHATYLSVDLMDGAFAPYNCW